MSTDNVYREKEGNCYKTKDLQVMNLANKHVKLHQSSLNYVSHSIKSLSNSYYP